MNTVHRALKNDFVRFLIIGATAVVIDVAVYLFLTRITHLHYLVARACSLFVVLIWSYSANRYWTFGHTTARLGPSFAKFTLVNGVSVALNLIGMRILVGTLGAPDILSLLFLSGGISIFSFASHKRWSFRSVQP
jgi:putative flippase GtrA